MKKLRGVPKVFNNGQGGLMDIQLHPDYAKNGWIYLTYAKPDGNKEGGTVVSTRKTERQCTCNLEELFKATPTSSSGIAFWFAHCV
jgi:glucose/arabinose dehydrogenase